MNTLLRRRSMIAAGGGSPTPPAVMIPYIRGGADGSYIDTGITPDNTTKVIVWARNFNPPIASHMLFGYIDSGANTNSFGIGAWGGASCGRIGVYFANYTNPYTIFENAWTCLGGYHKYELDGKVLKIDDEVKVTSTSTDTITTVHSMHLFGRSTGGTHTAMTLPADICACKIYKNGTLVRDYTAVNSPSVGLYDAVSDMVFTNAGSGSFTYGEFNKDAYIPLEYIESNGSQYFDSGVKGAAAVPIVSKFRIVGTNKVAPSLFGTFTSGTASSYFLLQFGTDSSKNSRANFYINSTTALQMYNNTSSRLTDRDVTVVKTGTSITLYENNAAIGSQKTFSVGSSWETPVTFAVATSKSGGGFASGISFEGRIYYFGIGANKNYVPCKNGDKVGMYDTYNDVFVESATSTPFTAGPQL